jgi:hypothetical protein
VTARDFESTRSENLFALIFVKSRHDRGLFRMKTFNVQRPTSNLQRGIIDLAFSVGDQRWAGEGIARNPKPSPSLPTESFLSDPPDGLVADDSQFVVLSR